MRLEEKQALLRKYEQAVKVAQAAKVAAINRAFDTGTDRIQIAALCSMAYGQYSDAARIAWNEYLAAGGT